MSFSERYIVWVVDDSPMEAAAIQRSLAGSCDVAAFRDGPSFLERLSLGSLPDVVVLDWMLPGSSGLDICRFVRQQWDAAKLPILLLTARDTSADIVEGLSAGANDYLAKPYAAAELAARANGLARLRRNHQRALRAEAEVRERELQFRRLAENLPDVVSRFDTQHRHLYVSPGITRLGGIPSFHFIGKTNAELGMPPELVQSWSAAIDTALGGSETSMSFDFVAADGLRRHFHSRLVPERDEQGQVTSVLCIARDVTAQVRAEQALRESEERLRLAIAAGDIGTWDYDARRRELTCDSRSRALLGLRAEQALDRASLSAALHAEDRPRVIANIESTLAAPGQAVYQDEFRTVGAEDGVERWVAVQGRILRDARGAAERSVGTLRDISERKHQEQESSRMMELEQRLVGIVGHDLRNPISAISFATTLLSQRLRDPELLRKVHVINAATERASRIIRDLLDLTRARLGGGIPIQPQPCDLHAIILQVVEEHRAAHPGRDIHLKLPESLQGVWDAARLAQVVANLVSNALNHSPAGSPVDVRVEAREGECVLSIHNQGAPISAELLPRIFQSFIRGESSGGRKSEGLGLGLYIAERIVTAHSGRILVSSMDPHGTTFSVHLPWRAHGLQAG
ncbi:PAS domain S-box protein [Hyalangium gracile]|uniref:PAS domain S-box protein n=1 Tax=Hyalangium gracile TaxID=394092 RepID=UPI001CCB023A|nr:PAS domain S-box protein [Hyalangium gracile]